jgi:transposase
MMQTPSVALHIGADVGKDEIVVASAEGSFAPRRVANQHAALLAWLKELPAGSRIGVEATGSYHELLAELAHKRGFVVYVLNPKDTRHYAKAMGLRGKTDRVDAELIARLIAHEHAKLHLWIPPTAEQREIDRLLRRRAKLSGIRASLTNSFKDVTGFAPELKALRQRLDQLLARLDARIKTLIEANAERKENHARLRKIAGVGTVVASGVLNTLERVPFAKADSFVAFTGLDPRPDDSAHRRGRRRLSKRGPSELRRLLYLAAMAAAKTKIWKPIYQHYRAQGLSSTAALVVLARRIARTAWSIYTHKTTFDAERITKALT